MNAASGRQKSAILRPFPRMLVLRACGCARESRRGEISSPAASRRLGSAPRRLRRAAQTPADNTRIDVHHHYVPPVHAEVMATHRVGGRPPKWSPQLSLDDMDKGGVKTAVLSLVQPGVWFGDVEQARKLSRECNEYGVKLAKDYPGRFGLFAAIPLPDTEGSLREIAYALDVLKADGISLFSSYGDKYLGDPAFVPVFEELNRRKAVVYTHPTTPPCCTSLIKGVAPGTIEFATDTTRTIASLLFGEGGTAFRCPDIRFIWSHSGGTLPFLIGRFIREQFVKKDPRMPDGPVPIVQKYFYEVAQGNTPGQLAALLKLVPISQVMFGSDYPFRQATEAVEGLADYKFDAADLRAIDRETALKLMPRLPA